MNKRKFFFPKLVLILFLTGCGVNIDYLPEEFFELDRIKKYAGDEAKQFVDNLHLQPVSAETNEIGFYEKGNKSAIIYITYYEDESNAVENYKLMTEKISPGNSIFRDGKIIEKNDEQMYVTYGMGQKHFVFVQGEKLFWISISLNIADDFLNAYLNYIEL